MQITGEGIIAYLPDQFSVRDPQTLISCFYTFININNYIASIVHIYPMFTAYLLILGITETMWISKSEFLNAVRNSS